MKGSPIIATIVVILILLGIYAGTRTLLLDGNDKVETDPHAGHNHGAEAPATGHDDTSLETQFEITFSSKPKSIKITQPSTKKEILNTTEIDDVEFNTTAQMSLDGHHVELAVEIQWENPGPMNFAEISISPARHATKSATLKSDSDIDDIAEFHW
mgnify:CR=1 FL=1